jgi:hypothetical protein
MAETAETGVAKFGLADFKKLRSNDYFKKAETAKMWHISHR